MLSLFIFSSTLILQFFIFFDVDAKTNTQNKKINDNSFSAVNLERVSAIVVDAKTKKILYKQKIETLRYPASLVKLMTLYVVFEELEKKKINLKDKIIISRNAASQERRKLGLAEGKTIMIEDAIRSLIVLSANDIAVAIGEHISGSEKNFAARMTKRAYALGMKKTKFRNASGLHHPEQVTTAADMSKLALAIRRDFPQYYHYFSEEKFVFQDKVNRGHNKVLIDQKSIVDGLKTGYTRASGFNLATSTSDISGRPIVSVVMGSSTALARDNFMKFLVKKFSTIKPKA